MTIEETHNVPRVRNRISGTLFGPIGPFVAQSEKDSGPSYMYSFSEIVMCEWFSLRGGDQWLAQSLVIPVHERGGPYFTAGSIKQVQVAAWPSSTYHNTEEAGCAVDEWDAQIVSHRSGDFIQVTLRIAIAGRGTRLNRVGYQWWAYSSDANVTYTPK